VSHVRSQSSDLERAADASDGQQDSEWPARHQARLLVKNT
jgi:hypothetical protein